MNTYDTVMYWFCCIGPAVALFCFIARGIYILKHSKRESGVIVDVRNKSEGYAVICELDSGKRITAIVKMYDKDKWPIGSGIIVRGCGSYWTVESGVCGELI